MKFVRWGLYGVVAAIIAVQFYRPPVNASTEPVTAGIAQRFPVPASVDSILRRSCYDCHSNNTVYPWYAHVEPVGWYLNDHITHGKRSMNLDEYGTYRTFRQFRRFHDIQEQLETDEMPLPSYLLIHRYARLSTAEKATVSQWAAAMEDSMKAWYPPDSLRRPERRPPEGGARR